MDFLFLFVVLGSFLCGFIVHHVYLVQSEQKALSIVRARANQKGQEAQKDIADDLMSFILEVKEGIEENKASGKDIKTFATEKLPGILASHPRTVIRFGKQLKDLASGGELNLGGLSSLVE